jgi:hypothetical protein
VVVYTGENQYFHFVANSPEESNDYWFLIECWKTLCNLAFFGAASTINIWSDGGGKHFKLTPTITFFNQLAARYGKAIYCNFFASYHGHSICDAAAAHAKNKITMYMRDEKKPIKTPEEIINHIKEIKNVKAQISPNVKRVEKKSKDIFPTFKQIKTPHFFMFLGNTVFALPHTPQNIAEETQKAKEIIKNKKRSKNNEFFFWRCNNFDFFTRYCDDDDLFAIQQYM